MIFHPLYRYKKLY